MPSVTCPECSTRQPVGAQAGGYACAECGRDWRFVTCASCGGRFHAGPGVRSWTCPSCGQHQSAPISPAYLFGEIPRPAIAGVAAVLVALALIFALTRGGVTPAATSTGSASSSAAARSAARAALCAHVLQIQVLRVDALAQNATILRRDADALATAGDTATAKGVKRLVAGIEQLRAALKNQQNADPANAKIQRALGALPC